MGSGQQLNSSDPANKFDWIMDVSEQQGMQSIFNFICGYTDPNDIWQRGSNENKRPQAIEPIIGHLKANHRMNQCFLKGSKGDSLHAVLFAAGYNILWLRSMIVKKGIDLFLLLPQTSGLGKISRQLREIFIKKMSKSEAMPLVLT